MLGGTDDALIYEEKDERYDVGRALAEPRLDFMTIDSKTTGEVRAFGERPNATPASSRRENRRKYYSRTAATALHPGDDTASTIASSPRRSATAAEDDRADRASQAVKKRRHPFFAITSSFGKKGGLAQLKCRSPGRHDASLRFRTAYARRKRE